MAVETSVEQQQTPQSSEVPSGPRRDIITRYITDPVKRVVNALRSPDQPQTDSVQIPEQFNPYISRRRFLQYGAAGFGFLLVNPAITPNNLNNLSEQSSTENINHEIDELLAQANELHQKTSLESGANGNNGRVDMIINWAGAALFGKAVRELLPGGRGHIGATEYATLAGLIFAKYLNGDEETKHHVQEEIYASLQALAIIAGSSTMAQGLKLDVERAYQESYARAPKLEDKVAIMTMASAVISPIATTVSSAAALTEEAQALARDIWELHHKERAQNDKDLDHPTVAALIDHVANSSGFILFGDPPWIAMMEKFGLQEGLKYQLETMWPMALMSLLVSNIKINERIIEAETGMSGIQAKPEAFRRSVAAISRNLPFLTSIITRSLCNSSKYFSGAEALIEKINQDPRGFELSILGVFRNKLCNVVRMTANNEDFKFPLHDESAFDGLTTEHIPELEADETFLENSIAELIGKDAKLVHEEVAHFLDNENYVGLENWLVEHGKPEAIYLVEVLRKMAHNRADKYITSIRSGLSQTLETLLPGLIGDFYRRINLHRFHNAAGSQLSDVLDVFPFQAGSVIFLSPIFKQAFESLRNNLGGNGNLSVGKDIALDFATYSAIMLFSTIADNYVAEKLGLDVDPSKAHLVTIAAIRGGVNLSPLSNMADPTLMPMHTYGLADSGRQMWRGLDQHAVGFVWSEIIDKVLIPLGVYKVPEPIAKGN